MLHTSPDIQLQACLADPDGVSEYPRVIPSDDISFEPALKAGLPPFPPGDWNEGRVAKDKTTGNNIFATTTRRDLSSVKNIWHEKKVDHFQLTWVDRMRQNIRLVTCPLFEHPVVYKFAEFPWQIPIMEMETTAYGWIDGQGVGPQFLGHVTEAGRVIGFLLENIPGRTAEVEDLEKCQHVLKRLHALGLKHGDINKYNFLIRDGDGKAVLVDFETTTKCEDEKELLRELEELREQLEETDGRGGIIQLED